MLEMIVARSGMDAEEAHCTLNMGVGWAVYCAPGSAESVVAAARDVGLFALRAGSIEAGPRQVILQPLGLTLAGERLELTP